VNDEESYLHALLWKLVRRYVCLAFYSANAFGDVVERMQSSLSSSQLVFRLNSRLPINRQDGGCRRRHSPFQAENTAAFSNAGCLSTVINPFLRN
jgi:hypothetical protein